MGTKHINWDMTHNDITPRTLGNKNTTFFGWNCQQRENTHRISSLQDASCKVFSTSWKKIAKAKKCKKWCVGLFSEQKWDEMGQWDNGWQWHEFSFDTSAEGEKGMVVASSTTNKVTCWYLTCYRLCLRHHFILYSTWFCVNLVQSTLAARFPFATPPHPRRSMTYVCWVQYNMTLAYHDVITPPHPTPDVAWRVYVACNVTWR